MFWNQDDTAGPALGDIARFWDRKPRYLRPTNRARPQPFDTWNEPTVLSDVHAPLLAAFWSTHYRGADWRFMLGTTDIQTILADRRTLALGVFATTNGHSTLVATIVARPLTDEGAVLRVGTQGLAEGAYMVEGLCVDAAWRGKHLAGWLISWVDFLLCKERPRLFLWSREAPTALSTTNIAIAQYAYMRSRDLSGSPGPRGSDMGDLVSVPWETFRTLWAEYSAEWVSETTVIPTSLPPSPIANGAHLHVWVHSVSRIVVVLSDTLRRTRTNEAVWELVWCGRYDGALKPWTKKGDARIARMLEQLVSQTKNETANGTILFVTDVPHQGGATTEWGLPWVLGTSGFHQTYIYNFMPPAFWSMTVMLPRWEL